MQFKLKLYTLLLTILFLVLVGLYWMAPGVLLFGGAWVVLSSKMGWITRVKKHGFLIGFFSITMVFILAISIRLFIFEIFSIPSPSMENSILPGDKIIVSKLNYGPQLPRSPFEIPWVNILFYLNKEARAKANEEWWDIKRLNGFTQVKHSDIVVFERPGTKEHYIKRCVGLPGDIIEIKNAKVFVNGKPNKESTSIKHRYQLWSSSQRTAKALTDSIGLNFYWRENGTMEADLTDFDLEKVKSMGIVDSISRVRCDWGAFPLHAEIGWTFDNFGSVKIPAKGLSIQLNTKNLLIYNSILRDYEGVEILEEAGNFYIDGVEQETYQFKHDYYFMMGDNRSDSQDSRYWGFVPDQIVVGKAVVVLFSNNQQGINFKRTFKKL